MADEQQAGTGQAAESSAANESQATSTSSDGQAQEHGASQKTGSWLDRVLGRGSRSGASESSSAGQASQAETQESKSDGKQQQAATPETKAEDGNKLVLTQEELDRRVQAEADRREAKRRAEASRQQKRDLAKNDPVKLAEMVEQELDQEDHATRSVQHFAPMLQTAIQGFDAAVLDPIIGAVPEAERKGLADKVPGGLDGRREIVKRSLKALEKHWKAEGAKEARANILKDPVARKQLLVDLRGTSDEPDVVPGANGGASFDMNAMIRGARGGRRR